MKDTTTTAPALPDAIWVAINDWRAASYYVAEHPTPRRVDLHNLAFSAVETAIRAALDEADADAEARGRAAAFRDVTDAIETLAVGAWNGSVSVSCHGTPPELRWSAGSSKTRATDDLVRVTPIAALRAAAAALGGDA